MDTEFARAAPHDAAECVRLRGLTRENAVSEERLREAGITVQSWAEGIATGALPGWVCRRDGRMAGYCFGDAATGEVVVLALLPEYESLGLGRQLLGRVIQDLVGRGHTRLFLGCAADPAVRSHGFYRHLGWRSTGRFDARGDEILELDLDHNGTTMTSPRIPPIEPPYPPELQAEFDKIMRGAPPLKLFRTVARNPRVLQRMMAGGLLDKGSISLRLRELVILRTCALCGAEYEWGVHVATFGGKAGLTGEQVRSTVRGSPEDTCWSDEDRAALRLADQLHETSHVDDALWQSLAGHFAPDQLVELVMLAGLYHAVSFAVNALGVEHEDFAARFPAPPGAPT